MEKFQSSKELRLEFKAIRDGMTLEDRNAKSQRIVDGLLALLESDFKGANIFLCFYPLGSEVDLRPLYKALLEAGKDLYFPVSDIKNHELSFHNIRDLDKDFSIGCFNVKEPNKSLPELPAFDSNTIVITPGLIFDEKCNRIGYGAGFYDRFYTKHPEVVKIGVAFEEQMVLNLDIKEHDVPLDYIVTNDRLIKRGV
ncbi:5-formyltetrahydrofolate cyclo-ligase [Pseudobutyrivibrio sp. YE44]|uniref:5-formyltetrahydrofolate cyclo-ligase n=1 Tax=Pseudobutyrivibrio sp. YE44 TaxID=1520802 RepID=UPI000882D984|nr:5-formyltetrahydrofolate cyclo-ligase [Pseudobutyrivibrio sp. YE44]SDB09031.1 5-formyltetrahydrofolate cyclo-ligase [Pseudobutyrivibrio sp. YE44]